MTEKEFSKKVKSLIEANPHCSFRFFIGDVFRDTEPSASVKVENYQVAREILKEFIIEETIERDEDFENQSPINIYFVIYQKYHNKY